MDNVANFVGLTTLSCQQQQKLCLQKIIFLGSLINQTKCKKKKILGINLSFGREGTQQRTKQAFLIPSREGTQKGQQPFVSLLLQGKGHNEGPSKGRDTKGIRKACLVLCCVPSLAKDNSCARDNACKRKKRLIKDTKTFSEITLGKKKGC